MKLRTNIRALQLLENQAAGKAGVRFLLIDEAEIFGKQSGKYIQQFISSLLKEIGPEIIAAAKLGLELRSEVKNAGE